MRQLKQELGLGRGRAAAARLELGLARPAVAAGLEVPPAVAVAGRGTSGRQVGLSWAVERAARSESDQLRGGRVARQKMLDTGCVTEGDIPDLKRYLREGEGDEE